MHKVRSVIGVILAAAVAELVCPKLLLADVQPRPEQSFQGKIGLSVKDSVPAWPQPIAAAEGAPNIVLILLDDVGFAASSTFGGPVQTPELEKLAAQGLRYNRFHVTALCSPTRAALLSGRNDHAVGFGTVANAPNGYPGYNSVWRDNAVTVADVLRRNGYSTAAFGKWHNTPYWEINPTGPFDRWPTGLGFEYFYGEMQGSTDQWTPTLYRNTTSVNPPATPEQGYHFTADITNEAIQWVHTLQSLAPDKPYFLYFATDATHTPLQAPKEWIDKYRGQFDQGWDKLREESFARQRKLGIVPADAKLTSRPPEIPVWSSLSVDQKKWSARQMEVFAGYLAHTDYEVGRLLETVRKGPRGANTLVLYVVGDNGGDVTAGLAGADASNLSEQLSHLDQLGGQSGFTMYASGWGWATNTPFQGGKFDAAHLGGTRDPLIVSWPARIKDQGGLRTHYTHVNDVAATLYEVARIPFPAVVDGVKQRPLDGASFVYSFDHPNTPSRHRVQLFEQSGNRSIYQDGWIAAASHMRPWKFKRTGDFDSDSWELYHIDTDFSQAQDLAGSHPQKLKELKALFEAEARRNDVYPLLEYGGDPQSAPSLARGRRQFVFYPDLPPIPANLDPLLGTVLPDFRQAHRLTADLVIPDKGAEGVVAAQGPVNGTGGFAFYVKEDRLVYESDSGGKPVIITSGSPLPSGDVRVAYEFIPDETAEKLATSLEARSGTVHLYVNEEPAGEGKVMFRNAGTFEVGRASHSPLSSAFSTPFRFSGALKQVQVDLK